MTYDYILPLKAVTKSKSLESFTSTWKSGGISDFPLLPNSLRIRMCQDVIKWNEKSVKTATQEKLVSVMLINN